MSEAIVTYKIRAGKAVYDMAVTQNGFGGYTFALYDGRGSLGKFTVFSEMGGPRTQKVVTREVARITGVPQTQVEAV